MTLSDLRPSLRRHMSRPRLISLFSGAGGLDYGFEAAGFDTAVAVEMNHACCETLRANRKWAVIERDLFQVPSDEILETGSLRRGDAALLIGGPPCQPFSKSSYWVSGDAARLDDPRSNTLGAYLRVLEDALPQAFVLENVEGLAYRGKDEGLRLLLKAIAAINRRTKSNYQPTFQVLNAAELGVPQQRKRLIMVASREGTSFTFPGSGQLPLFAGGSKRTAWDAIGDVVPAPEEDLELTGRWAELLPSIPEGHNYQWHTDRMDGEPLFGWRRHFWSFLLKLAKDQPSWTIQAQPGPASGPFHWANRRLSIRELCRLQTFPDDVKIIGNRASVQRQVGNAVPSLLAEVLGRSIRTQLLDLSAMRGELKLLPPRRTPTPSPEKVTNVPRKYWSLRGKHTAHPGTGLGNAAQLRL
jgi:DNA (cytosine-5)-methyltransferase 1